MIWAIISELSFLGSDWRDFCLSCAVATSNIAHFVSIEQNIDYFYHKPISTEKTMKSNHRLFQGSIVALVTPMKDDGQIDYTALCRLIDWHIECGTSGLVIMGTTGESATVTEQEHFKIVETAITHSDKRIPIIAGCSSPATQKTIELAKSLNVLNPDAFLCVTPYYIKAMQEGLYRHFSEVADACHSPVLLYNVPSRTACDLENETVIKLANNSNIVGIKDAVGDIQRSKELIDGLGDNFCLLSGDDPTAYEFIKSGGVGVITVTGNVVPDKMSQWCNLLLEGEILESKVIFDNLMPLHEAMFVESNPMPAKWALKKLAKIESGIRLPLTQPSIDAQQRIKRAMQQCGIL
jgi:4-hydroxy-tetrahydrodipicolinate synthase